MDKLIISSEDLRMLQELAQQPAETEPSVADPLLGLPPRVRAFWLHENSGRPPWRREGNALQNELDSIGGWTG